MFSKRRIVKVSFFWVLLSSLFLSLFSGWGVAMAERPAESSALPGASSTSLAATSAFPASPATNLPAVADTASESAPLVVIGFSGVRFSHIDRARTPHLADFLENSAAWKVS